MKLVTCAVGINSCVVNNGWVFEKTDRDSYLYLSHTLRVLGDNVPLYVNELRVRLGTEFKTGKNNIVVDRGKLVVPEDCKGAFLTTEKESPSFYDTILLFLTVNTSEDCVIISRDDLDIRLQYQENDKNKAGIFHLSTGEIYRITLGGVDTFKLYAEKDGIRVLRIDNIFRRIYRWVQNALR